MQNLVKFVRAKTPGEEFYDNFSEGKNKTKWARVVLSTTLLLLVVLAGRAHVIDYEFSRFFDFEVSKRNAEFLFAFLVAVASSLTASFVFLLVIERRERRSILNLTKYAPVEFLKDFVDNIAHYDGIIRYDHLVVAKLRDHPNRDDIILCDLEYRYWASRLPKTLSFKMHRIADEASTAKVPLIGDECLENEFVWYNSEYDFPEPVEIADYEVSGLEVGNSSFEIKKTKSTKNLLQYECDIGARRTSPTLVKYRATIPLETETIFTVTSEFITKDSQLRFDYSGLSKPINPCIMSFAGIKENILFDDHEKNKMMSRRLDGWLLPRNGWVISWWSNE